MGGGGGAGAQLQGARCYVNAWVVVRRLYYQLEALSMANGLYDPPAFCSTLAPCTHTDQDATASDLH